MRIGILLPAYNEEKNIERVLKDVLKYFDKRDVLVVDDGSQDKTAEIAERIGVNVLRHEVNQGKAGAIKTGISYFKARNYDAVVVFDADGQFKAKDAKKMSDIVEYADVVFGMRDFSKVPFRHRLANAIWRFFFNLLFRTKLRDTNCGIYAFSRKAMEEITEFGKGYELEIKILAQAVRKKLRIIQVPVDVVYKEKSGIKRGVRIFLRVFLTILRERLR